MYWLLVTGFWRNNFAELICRHRNKMHSELKERKPRELNMEEAINSTNKTTTTFLKPNLKQVLLNTGQGYECWPDLHPRCMLRIWYWITVAMTFKGKTLKVTYFNPPSSNKKQAYLLMYFLLSTSCLHPVQLGNHACLQKWKHVALYPR